MRKLLVSVLLLLFAFQNTAQASTKLGFGTIDLKPLSYRQHTNLILELQLEPGWHIYWHNPGAAGVAPKLETNAPNVATIDWRLPTPSRLSHRNVISFGYEGNVAIPITITPRNSGDGVFGLLEVSLVACNTECRFKDISLPFSVSPGFISNENLSPSHRQPHAYNQKLDAILNTTNSGSSLLFEASTLPPNLQDIFISIGDKAFSYSAPKLVKHNDKDYWQVVLRGSFTPPALADELDIVVTTSNTSYQASGKITGAASFTTQSNSSNFAYAILAAFIGGFILNFMPCVLPVLSIKILALVKMKKTPRSTSKVKREFCFTILGIMSGFLLLATLITALNYAGIHYAWGSQFQSPAFLIIVILALVFVTLNLLDVTAVALPAKLNNQLHNWLYRQHHDIAAFATGMLAMVLATPCTAPFLTTALAATINTSSSFIFIIMSAIGLGLALPYILALLHPDIMRYLPKPGRWMAILRRILALGVLVTVVWLGTLLYNKVSSSSSIKESAVWHKFEPELIRQLVEEGKIVLVDVTADWCLICKFNDANVFKRHTVIEALSSPRIYAMRADLSKHDHIIDIFLTHHKHNGIPFNIVFSSTHPEGVVLPELLSASELLSSLE